MESIQFAQNDAWILWTIPSTGAEIADILRGYVFSARDAIPSYEMVANCLKRAIHAGILEFPLHHRFSLTPEWYAHLHSRDTTSACPEDGLIECEEHLVSAKWPVMEQAEFLLSKALYDNAAATVAAYYRTVFEARRS